MRNALFAALTFAAAFAGPAFAQPAAAPAPATPAEQPQAAPETGTINVSWTIPDSPAAAALDVARSETSPPSIARLISYEVLNADDAVGFAGEVSPYLLYQRLRGDSVLSIERYQEDYVTRALARLSISAAALPSADDGDRAAAALRWTAFNRADPYLDRTFQNCLATAVLETREDIDTTERAPTREEREQGLRPQIETRPPTAERLRRMQACVRPELAENAWNATALQFAAVQLWRSDDGFDNLESGGTRVSAILSYGFDSWKNLKDNSQLLLSVAAGENIEVPDDEGENLVRRDETTIGLRLRVAPPMDVAGCHSRTARDADGQNRRVRNGRCFNIYGEAEFSEHDYDTGQSEEEWSYTLGAEWEVRPNMWLGFSAEERSGDDVTGDDTRAGMQIRFAFSEEARYSRPR